MKDNIKIKYTDTALEQLEIYKMEQVKLLEEYLVKDKYVMGDELVEITASDIKEAFNQMKVSLPKNEKKSILKSEAMKTASIMYTILGTLITIVGLYFDKFQEIQLENPKQAMLILVGVAMTFAGLLLNLMIRRRESNAKQKEIKSTNVKIENNYFEN